MRWSDLPPGMGRYEELTIWIVALVGARRRIEQGEGSIEETRAVEEKVETACWNALSSGQTPANLPPEIEKSDRAGAQKLMKRLRRGETL